MTSSVRQQGAPPHGRGPAAAAAAAAAAATAAPVPPMRSSSSNGDLAPSGSSKHFMGWSCADVLAWIRTLPNLDESMRQRAIDAFTENDIDGATMASLSKQDLKDELGIQSLGLRSKLWESIQGLRDGPEVSSGGAATTKRIPKPAAVVGGANATESNPKHRRIEVAALSHKPPPNDAISREPAAPPPKIREVGKTRLAPDLRTRLDPASVFGLKLRSVGQASLVDDDDFYFINGKKGDKGQNPRKRTIQKMVRRMLLRDTNVIFADDEDTDWLTSRGALAVWIPPVNGAPSQRLPIRVYQKRGSEIVDFIDNTGNFLPAARGAEGNGPKSLNWLHLEDDAVLPTYGESENEGMSITDHSEDEGDGAGPPVGDSDDAQDHLEPGRLSPEEARSILDACILQQETAWQESVLPRLQRRAHIVYRARHMLPDMTLELENLRTVRLPKLITAILASAGQKKSSIRNMAEHIRESTYLRMELQWKIQICQLPASPVAPKVAKVPSSLKRKRRNSSGESSEDEHWSDFIASDDDEIFLLDTHSKKHPGTPSQRPGLPSPPSWTAAEPFQASAPSTPNSSGVGSDSRNLIPNGGSSGSTMLKKQNGARSHSAQSGTQLSSFRAKVDQVLQSRLCSTPEIFLQLYSERVAAAALNLLGSGQKGQLDVAEGQLFEEFKSFLVMRSNDIVNSEQPVAEKAFDAFRSVHPHTVERAAEFLEWRKKFLGFDIYFSQPNEIELEGEGTTGNGEHLAITSTRKTSEPDPKRPRPKNAEPPEVIDLTSEPSEADDSTVFEVDVARKSTGKKKGRRDIHEIRPESPSVQRMRDNRRQQEAQILARAKRQKHPTYKVIINLGHSDDEAPIYIDDFLARHLKPHQIDGVQFLWRTAIMIKQETLHGDQSNHTGSILAHSMGLGKTLQAIVFVYTLMREVRAGNPCLPEHLKNGSGVLLVVPAIVVENWANEFDKWISKALQRKILGGIHVFPPSDKSVREVAQPFLEEWSSNRGVFIMSYTTYRILSTRPAFLADAEESNPEVESFRRRRKLLADPGPAVVICDEGHMIKNPKSAISATLSQVKTPTRICLTGYPLQNNLDEYFCMIDFVAPGFLGSLDEFRNQYHNPIANGFYVDSTPGDKQLSKERLYVLVNIIQPIVQRKDDSALRKELPLKNEYIITVKLTKEQYDVYMKYRKFCGDWYTEETILAQTSGLIMICSHPQAFKLHLEKTLRTSKKKEAKSLSLEPGAPIAEAVNDESGPTPQTLDSEASLRDSNGGNSAGTTQLESMGKDDAFKSLVRLLFDQDKDIAHRNWGRIELSFKMMMAVEIVRMSTALGDKVLVFSRYLSTLQYLRDLLTPQFEVQLLTGAAGQNRQKLIDDFNSPGMQFKVFLISTNCGGVGVNLVTANRVILIDHGWNPSLDQQAIARAYRYGQEKPTYVYRLLTYSTFEDKLHKTNIHKINLATEVVDKKNTAKLLNRDQQKKYLEPPVNPENVVSELDPNASFTDGVMTELVNKFKSGIVSINSHEEFVGEVEDDMTEHQKNRAKIALESEVNRRKSKQPISKGILSGPALSAATVLAEAEAAGNLAVGQGSAGSDGSTVPMASDLSKSVDVDDGIVDDSTEEDFPGDQDDFTKELYLMGAGLWIDEGS